MNDNGNVMSFEPDPDNCHWFTKSLEANSYDSVQLFRLALSDTEGSATFYPGQKSGWGSLVLRESSVAEDQEPFDVETRTLDSVLAEQGVEAVDVIKVDVEGAELPLLVGAENTLKKSRNIKLLFDIDVQDPKEEDQIYDFLSSLGFETFKI